MYWYVMEDEMDYFDYDDNRHQVGDMFAVYAKNEKEAFKTADKWSSATADVSILGRWKTFKAAQAGMNKTSKLYAKKTLSFGVKDGSLLSIRDAMNESFKVNSPTLNKLVNMEYSDPRQKDGCKIVAEKCGQFEGSNGNYIMYQDNALPGKFVAVHVSDDMNEESGEANVSVVALGNSRKKVMQNMAYRARRNKSDVVED